MSQIRDAPKPDIFLLHGWAMHGGIFESLVTQLESRFRVRCVDLPGHGFANAETLNFEHAVAQLCELAGQHPGALWAGWSLGGLFATEVCLRAPSWVGGLAAISSSPCFVQKAGWRHGMAQATFAQFAASLQADWPAVVQRFLALEAMGSPHERDELRWLQAQVYTRGEPSAQALQAGLAILLDADNTDRLQRLTCPSVWIGGSRDRLVPPDALHFAAQRSGGEVIIIPRASHAPFLTYPEEVAACLTKLAAELA